MTAQLNFRNAAISQDGSIAYCETLVKSGKFLAAALSSTVADYE